MAVNNASSWQVRGSLVVRQQTVEQGATPVAGGRMHHHANWLVNDHEVRVFKHHVQAHGLWREGHGLRGGAQLSLHLLPSVQLARGRGDGLPFDTHSAVFDQVFEMAARKGGSMHRQPLVQALAVPVRAHAEAEVLHLGQHPAPLPWRFSIVQFIEFDRLVSFFRHGKVKGLNGLNGRICRCGASGHVLGLLY